MDTRSQIIDAAARLLAEHGVAGTSTRAICAAAGITAPTLYHHFGDKDGLLEAVVADGWARYLRTKRDRKPDADPVAELKRGWDEHVAFGVSNPTLYALMFPAVSQPELPAPVRESYAVLLERLEAIELAGRLRPGVTKELAAGAVWAAVYGVTSLLCSRPELRAGSSLSHLVRDGVLDAITCPAPDPAPDTEDELAKDGRP
jgi:AcrR family transcriptional regulator